jgi:hypothetical protein
MGSTIFLSCFVEQAARDVFEATQSALPKKATGDPLIGAEQANLVGPYPTSVKYGIIAVFSR